ncbi:metallophosphoesterase family protein [Paenibacillus mesophilus]|uniref:metallophosphoesterase family protein n=1 Tax=Paenibacillus mesophilus TaxID=2582849 RepID=UPI0013053999|nr:metallophosphoesterase [Paenibacillus mesophilus]
MKIAFVGDLHGRVLHSLAIMSKWQIQHKQKLDWIIQVGDFGAYPHPNDQLKQKRRIDLDPSQFDFSRYLRAEGKLADQLQYIRTHFARPVYFIRGNHEDFEWLAEISSRSSHPTESIDPFGLFAYVKDGTVIKTDGPTIAFLGGVDNKIADSRSIDEEAYRKLTSYPRGEINILVTHDAPYGAIINEDGELRGSQMLLELIETIQPKYMIGGHFHHMNGPKTFGATTYLGLNLIIYHKADETGTVKPGSFALLDTDNGELSFITDEWLSTFHKGMDFVQYCEELQNTGTGC